MTMIDRFMDFVQSLPADSTASLELTLAQIIESWSGKADFTPDQLAELERRLAEENPEMAANGDIEAIFGKPLSR